MKISQKQQFGQDHKIHLVQVKPNGMKIVVDDDVVQQISEGQDMTAEVSQPHEPSTDHGSLSTAIEVNLHYK